MNFRDIFLAPLRAAGFLMKVVGRVTMGAVGFLLMGAGLLLIEPLGIPVAGIPLFLVGLVLTVRAIF
ncbi:MAG: hypothetical protein HYY16_05350 [Planctomycetes bacterium]|nr:hypothetical protein [Planctomycetota bacterium]